MGIDSNDVMNAYIPPDVYRDPEWDRVDRAVCDVDDCVLPAKHGTTKNYFCHYHYQTRVKLRFYPAYNEALKEPLVRCEANNHCQYPAVRQSVSDGEIINICGRDHQYHHCYRATCDKDARITFLQSGIRVHSCKDHFGKLRIFG